MKMRLLLLMILVLGFTSCNKFTKENRVLAKTETDSIFVVSVPNAGCKNCQRIMEGKLKNEKGVKQSILNLQTKEVSILYDPNLISPQFLDSKVSALRGQLPCK